MVVVCCSGVVVWGLLFVVCVVDWSLVVCCVILFVYLILLVGWFLVACWCLLVDVVRCGLFVVYCLLRVVCCVLFVEF